METSLAIKFEPAEDTKELIEAVEEYEEIWNEDGAEIVAAFEKVAGIKFNEKEVRVVVYEGISRSGRSTDEPMRLRASYPADVKKGTLIHELGHRFLFGIGSKEQELDSHQLLFLILYDVWTELYGEEFADKQVAVESARKGVYDYEKTWLWALGLGKKKRNEMFLDILQQNS